MRITFIFIYVDRHVRFVPPSRPQYTLRRESQQRSNAVGLAKVYSVCTSNLASHRVVVCAERNGVFSTFTIIVIGVIVVVVVVVIVTTHYVNDFKRVDVFIKSRVSKIHLCLALRTNLREL